MGIRLEITTDVGLTAQGGPSQRAQIDDALNALGFMRETRQQTTLEIIEKVREECGVAAPGITDEEVKALIAAEAAEAAAAPKFVTNTPRAGESEEQTAARSRKRRTKAEIDAEKAAEAPQIQTQPENRVDPETAAQDTADEAAESEATKASGLTLDDVRAALGGYVTKYGMDAAQKDGPALFKLLFGEGVAKISDVPKDQASVDKAVAGAREMLEKNPYKRAEV